MQNTTAIDDELKANDANPGAASTLSDLQQQIEKVAEQYVLIDGENPDGLALLFQNIEALAQAFRANAAVASPIREKCVAALEQAARMVDAIKRGDGDNPQAAFVVVGRTLLALQKVGREDHVSKMGFPEELGIDFSEGGGGHGSAPPERLPSEKPAAEGDRQILQLFLDQEMERLSAMEDAILALEKGSRDTALAEFKRTLHTMKGDAGVVGAEEISSVCHKLEDYIESAHQTPSVELLMEVRDWLEKAIRDHCDGKKPGGADALIGRLRGSAEAAAPPPEPKAQAPEAVAEKPAATEPPPSPAPVASIEIADKDLAREFVAEAQEYFGSADENLLILEKEPDNAEAIGAVFRAFHTMKGVVGFLGLKPIADLAHQAETLLDMVRNGKKSFAGSVVEATFRSLDMLKVMVADVNQAVVAGGAFSTRPELGPILTSLQDILAGREVVQAEKPAVERVAVPPAAEASEAKAEEGGEEKSTVDVGAAIKQAVKIDADRLDLLIDTIGELVIAESMVTQDREIKELRSLRVEKNMAHLGKITRMLQDMSMSMRMVPIEATFRKMARLVRDLSKKSGKRVELNLIGKETELDRAMVDKLNDPLVHMIRNSVDHGIEPEADRVAAGKPPVGHITLKAYHRGGSIHIEVIDDGKGLDREAILAKGIERGLIRADQNPSDKEIYGLIFEPGFSTAKQITEISGRGVGMDVVRRNLDSLRGNVLIDTVRGKGSTFTLVLPLTTAIIDGIMVRVGGDTYIIPTLSIVESFKPSADQISTVIGRGEVIQFRNSLLPLFRLSRLFSINDATREASRATVVVVEDNGKQTALLVDELLGQQQTVIKSLGEAVGTIIGISGASILADGHPGLILDVGGIVKLATGESKR
ncbi:MAG TPA: chemotaxis protein CheA [Verrucomicrobiae bacterium]|nr:chemotaxis protein CheA [Verrucomicrobiae bacterium]